MINERTGVLLRFRGEGQALIKGATEYLTFHTIVDDDCYWCRIREPAPGFELVNEAEVVLPSWFPEGSTLVIFP